jgi:LacI family transcriptional regulator
VSKPSLPSGRRPTLRDVARLADVSFKTVSRVVNGEAAVSPQLTTRVRAAIEQLGYRPDPTASTLRRADGRSQTVAAILEDLANPFSGALHGAIVAGMRRRGVLVLSASSEEDPDDEREALLAFIDRRVDGIVLMPTSTDHSWMGSDRIGDRHVVMVDRPAPGFAADTVVADNRGGAREATRHLIRHGHRRIAFVGGPPEMYTASERLAGHREALGGAGLALDPELEALGLLDSQQSRQAVSRLLTGASPPSAIFAGQNLLTIGAVRALRQLGVQREVALVGFDDIELAGELDPGITVMAQSPVEIGRTAAELLLRRLDGDTSAPQTQIVPTGLVTRGSGELLAPER